MNIIPVIDLKNGQVVAAQQGERESYQPIKSNLCKSSAIEDVMDFFSGIHPFKTLYIADLDAITGHGNNETLIRTVIKNNPSIEFWIDNGITPMNRPAIIASNYRPIIASECQKAITNNSIQKYLTGCILSLDFFTTSGYKGPIELLNKPSLWPENIIIMTLNRVGKNRGPDFEKLAYFQQKHPNKNFIAAGGIRNADDLIQLEKMGIHYALIASALHSGMINKQTIKKLISI